MLDVNSTSHLSLTLCRLQAEGLSFTLVFRSRVSVRLEITRIPCMSVFNPNEKTICNTLYQGSQRKFE